MDPAGPRQERAPRLQGIRRRRRRHVGRVQVPNLRTDKAGGVTTPSFDHPDGLIGVILAMRAMGTDSPNFLAGMLSQLLEASTTLSNPQAQEANFILSVIDGVEPRDQLEAMLAAQMGALQMASMKMAGRLARAETVPQQDSATRALAKLTRAFAQQVDALSRYRGKGQQVVRVEHVHVHAGGQAIVGPVDASGRGHDEKRDQPHAAAIEHARVEPMWCANATGDAVPGAGDEGEGAMPATRRRAR